MLYNFLYCKKKRKKKETFIFPSNRNSKKVFKTVGETCLRYMSELPHSWKMYGVIRTSDFHLKLEVT